MASNALMMVAIAHYDCKGQFVTHSVALSKGQEAKDKPEALSSEKDAVCMTQEQQVEDGTLESINGYFLDELFQNLHILCSFMLY